MGPVGEPGTQGQPGLRGQPGPAVNNFVDFMSQF